MRPRTLAITAAGLALAAVLTACGSSDESSMDGMDNSGSDTSSASSTSDTADVTFAQLMIPHHEQAIEMADLALKYAKSTEVRQLATQIQSAQGPEIEQMTQWLQDWGARTAMPSSDGDMGGMDMGGMESDGMMTEGEMESLAASRGSEFDRMWLRMMIAHHEGAIAMAQQVLGTTNTDAVAALAEDIIQAQQTEIETMQELLTQ